MDNFFPSEHRERSFPLGEGGLHWQQQRPPVPLPGGGLQRVRARAAVHQGRLQSPGDGGHSSGKK